MYACRRQYTLSETNWHLKSHATPAPCQGWHSASLPGTGCQGLPLALRNAAAEPLGHTRIDTCTKCSGVYQYCVCIKSDHFRITTKMDWKPPRHPPPNYAAYSRGLAGKCSGIEYQILDSSWYGICIHVQNSCERTADLKVERPIRDCTSRLR